jgi:hypothetical protein
MIIFSFFIDFIAEATRVSPQRATYTMIIEAKSILHFGIPVTFYELLDGTLVSSQGLGLVQLGFSQGFGLCK